MPGNETVFVFFVEGDAGDVQDAFGNLDDLREGAGATGGGVLGAGAECWREKEERGREE